MTPRLFCRMRWISLVGVVNSSRHFPFRRGGIGMSHGLHDFFGSLLYMAGLRTSFPKHFRYNENKDSSAKTSSEEEIY